MPILSRKTVLKLGNIFFLYVGTQDDTKKCNLRKKISGYMDRAENIKKYLDQEKEGKEAVLRECVHTLLTKPISLSVSGCTFGAL